MTTIHRYLTIELAKEALQAAGFRVTQGAGGADAPVLTSATAGLAFEVRLFNPLPELTGAFADATFRTVFQVRGELPLSLLNAWNVTHRFAKLHLAGAGTPDVWLLLDMDVLALGGVHADHLRVQIEIWDRLVQELIAYLRAELPKLAKAAPVAEPSVAGTDADAAAE